MRFKSTLFLAVVLAALCAYLYFIEFPGNEKKKKEEEAKQTVFSFSESDITQITITGAIKPISLLKMLDHPETPWKITAPIETVADENVASSFASMLARLKIIRTVDERPSDLTPFGLNPPFHSIRMILKGSNNDLLEVGSDGMAGNGLYARVGNAVYLVESGIKTYLSKPLKEWRRQELFRFVAPDVQSIHIEGPAGKIALFKKGGAWTGNSEKADPSKVMSFLGVLSSLRGDEFIDENKTETIAGLGDPFFRVKLSSGTVAEGSFYKVATKPEWIYAATNPDMPIYNISSERFEEINKPWAYFKQDLSPAQIPQ